MLITLLYPTRTVLKETRYCDRCFARTEHEILDSDKATYNPRGRTLYKCTRCGRVRSMRRLRPSAEASY
jgi:uncharacterized Zn finger protein